MLEQLRGREHRVWSGLCVWPRPGDVFDVEAAQTVLRMISLTDREIDEYLATGLWQGKAGGFGLQDRLGWIEIVAGSPSNVVGLPLELLAEMLAGIGQR
jgi:septum formation protein